MGMTSWPHWKWGVQRRPRNEPILISFLPRVWLGEVWFAGILINETSASEFPSRYLSPILLHSFLLFWELGHWWDRDKGLTQHVCVYGAGEGWRGGGEGWRGGGGRVERRGRKGGEEGKEGWRGGGEGWRGGGGRVERRGRKGGEEGEEGWRGGGGRVERRGRKGGEEGEEGWRGGGGRVERREEGRGKVPPPAHMPNITSYFPNPNFLWSQDALLIYYCTCIPASHFELPDSQWSTKSDCLDYSQSSKFTNFLNIPAWHGTRGSPD